MIARLLTFAAILALTLLFALLLPLCLAVGLVVSAVRGGDRWSM